MLEGVRVRVRVHRNSSTITPARGTRCTHVDLAQLNMLRVGFRTIQKCARK
jgi:hypothetical protein